MKKRMILLLTAVLLAVTAAAYAADATGVWQLLSIQAEGRTFSAASLGLTMTLTLKEDGSAAFYEKSSEGTEEDSGSWSASGADILVKLSGDTMRYSLSGEQLVFRAGGDTLTFGREQAAIPERAKPVEATGKDPFLGSWEIYGILVEDVLIDPEVEQVSLQLKVTDTEISFTFSDGGADGNGESAKESFGYTFENGKLKAEDDGPELVLCDDGTVNMIVSLTEDGQQKTITYCMKKAGSL